MYCTRVLYIPASCVGETTPPSRPQGIGSGDMPAHPSSRCEMTGCIKFSDRTAVLHWIDEWIGVHVHAAISSNHLATATTVTAPFGKCYCRADTIGATGCSVVVWHYGHVTCDIMGMWLVMWRKEAPGIVITEKGRGSGLKREHDVGIKNTQKLEVHIYTHIASPHSSCSNLIWSF